jgi:hypothetical protein
LKDIEVELYVLSPGSLMLGLSIFPEGRKQVEIFLLLFALSIAWGKEKPG